ncbi:hypothetical protein Agub_g183, partial [Astrephomene gubernaculifera]
MAGLLAVFAGLQAIILSLVNTIVKDDYMDEVFHGPQAREYCRGAFTAWHPKITTFPGIYYLGTLYGWARRAVQFFISPVGPDAACTTPFLRSLNVVLSIACLATLHAILQQQRRRGPAAVAASAACPPALHATLLALYPLHWFFSFLFYTDVASLLFLLLCQLQASRRRYRTAALAGAAAVLCRQTNAVWTAFVLGEAALAELGLLRPLGRAAAAQLEERGSRTTPYCTRAEGREERGGAAAAGADSVSEGSCRGPAAAEEGLTDGLVSELQLALVRAWTHRGALARTLWPLLLPPAGFVCFLLANGGSVVLGDKEAHRPVRHGAQLLYFAGWTAAMLGPQLLPAAVGGLARGARRRPLAAAVVSVVAVVAAAAVAHVSTMVHPYMLADNRHYVFYLWRRVLDRHALVKYALAPTYALAWALLVAALLRRVSRLWVLGFTVCLVAQLLPAWLLELRYFTPGFYLIALQLEPPTRLQALAMLALYGVVNAATMYLFLYRPYTFA